MEVGSGSFMKDSLALVGRESPTHEHLSQRRLLAYIVIKRLNMHEQSIMAVEGDNRNLRSNSLDQLYARAFSEYGIKCLWSWRQIKNPSSGHARVIARALRAEGGRAARELSWKIEDACDAADKFST